MELMLPLVPPAPAAADKELPLTEADKTDWPGVYLHPPSQRVEIVLKEGRLYLRRGSSDLPIRKLAADRISAAQEGAAGGQRYLIVRGKDGKTLYLHSGGRALKKDNRK
jgi:hypothetical protein